VQKFDQNVFARKFGQHVCFYVTKFKPFAETFTLSCWKWHYLVHHHGM